MNTPESRARRVAQLDSAELVYDVETRRYIPWPTMAERPVGTYGADVLIVRVSVKLRDQPVGVFEYAAPDFTVDYNLIRDLIIQGRYTCAQAEELANAVAEGK